MNSAQEKNSRNIKEWAKELGFMSCGIAKADYLEDEAPRLENWLKYNMHGKMGYMENHFDKRLDPRLLVPDAKSVVSLSYNYYTDLEQKETAPKLSKYAFGEDYHFVIKRKLKSLMQKIQENIGEVSGRCFVDSAPVLDKAWAAKSGLGWIGKHSNVLTKQAGSYYFISELIIDLNLEPDAPVQDHCGKCTACIDACPTGAIIQPYVVDGSKCISYFTIELKEGIPQEFKGKLDDWMFGCDVCQEVCPWNRFSQKHTEPAFEPHPDLLGMERGDWKELTQETFSAVFKKSAVKRTGFNGLNSTLRFLDV
ncbi:MAG: tRNA epoxyqueuosine(34) reductase QueG [Flavobacteriales bacterium]